MTSTPGFALFVTFMGAALAVVAGLIANEWLSLLGVATILVGCVRLASALTGRSA